MRSNLILMMSFSGGFLCLLYIMLGWLMGKTLTPRLRYGLLKVALLFYLFPFPEYKYLIPEPLGGNLMVFHPTINDKGYAVLDNVIQLGSDLEHTIIPPAVRDSLILLEFAIAMAGITLLVQLTGYGRAKRICKEYGVEKPSVQLEKIKAELRIRRKVKLVFLEDCKTPLSIGYFSPIIVVPLQAERYGTEKWGFIFRHELTHIRNGDFWVKLLGLIAMAVHCFNPLSYFLFFELCRIAEVYCDSLAVKDYTEAQRKSYCSFLLDLMTVSDSRAETRTMLPTVRLVGGGVKEIRGRILEMKTEKKKRCLLPVLLAAVIAATAWVAAYAYNPAPTYAATPGLEPDPDVEEILLDASPGAFAEPHDLYGPNTGDTFVDDEGNTYTVSGADGVSCSHSYVAATTADHELCSNGNCTVTYYSIRRCTKCGDTKNKTYSREVTYDPCIH